MYIVNTSLVVCSTLSLLCANSPSNYRRLTQGKLKHGVQLRKTSTSPSATLLSDRGLFYWRDSMHKYLLRLLTIGFLLAVLCTALQSTPASAQIAAAVFPRPQSTQHASIIPTRFGAIFTPGIVVCHQLQPSLCFTLTNWTRRPVKIFMNGRYLLTLQAGVTMSSEMTFFGQTNVFTIPRINRFTRLVVIAQRSMRCGRFGCFPPGRRF